MGKLCGVFPAMPGDDLVATLWLGRAISGDSTPYCAMLSTVRVMASSSNTFEGVVGEGVQLVDGNLLHLFPLLLLSIFLGGKQVI